MIPVKDITKVTDNVGGEETVMTVNPEDWKKISGLLINLYSDTILAVIREYSTNAWDSHIASGNTDKPIEVILPSAFSNLLVIRDYGTGMSKDDLQKVYAMFGASTKDTSNDFNGSMGLGSKSAMTYTDSFTVKSIKNGIETTAIVGRDEDGNSIMKVLPERQTSEPSGTTIEIPTKTGDDHKFVRRAQEFYRWWKPGTVLLNSKQPEHADLASANYEDLGNGDWVRASSFDSSITFVMGNVAYTHDFESPDELRCGLDVISFVDNGVVQFSPSRESLLMNRTTTKYVEKRIADVTARYVQTITDSISSAKTLKEAIQAFQKYSNILSDGASEWNGIKLGIRAEYDGRMYRPTIDETSKARWVGILGEVYDQQTAFLVNFGSGNLTRAQKDAILAYRTTLPDNEKFRYLYYQNDNLPPLMKDARTIDYQKVIKPLVRATQAQAKLETFDLFMWDAAAKEVKRTVRTLPPGKQYLYTSPTAIRGGWSNYFFDMSWIKEMKDVVVVVINQNRHAKFRKDHGGSENLLTYISKWLSKQVSGLTADEKEAARQADHDILRQLKGKTEDKHIDNLVDALVSYRSKVAVASVVASGMQMGDMDRFTGINKYSRWDNKDYVNKTYPLANVKHISHTVLYINMIHKENNK